MTSEKGMSTRLNIKCSSLS